MQQLVRSSSANQIDQICQATRYKKNRLSIVLPFVLSVIIIGIFIYYNSLLPERNVWANVLEPSITAVTFVIALALGINGLHKAWLDSLENRASYAFVFSFNSTYINDLKKCFEDEFPAEYDLTANKKDLVPHLKEYVEIFKKLDFKRWPGENEFYLIMTCLEAVLIHENDLRGWAQQIGAQISSRGKRTELSIFPYFKIMPYEIRKHHSNQYFKHYFYICYLQNIPENIHPLLSREKKEHLIENGWEDDYKIAPSILKFHFTIKKIDDLAVLEDFALFREYVYELKSQYSI